MKNMIIASAILVGGLFATGASAMPAVSIAKAPTVVVQVDYVCGPGFHQTPWGDCRRNGWRRGPPPPPPRFYGHHRPPPPYWGDRRWRHHRHYDDY
ncbi:GCG_CRPN prefix-to-repeats domain-containing protein [Rhizobium tumorigenes]|uniref:GCG_CRPN prefix-to-repeats domain-containing protein n=1 Tax=Rhizobium tumorigenes TaxID=2041385 RepID=UPI00241FDFBB|nr:hypothetical protein [Rhizobium tumorigenes]WFS01948.1 hypothetical protein PR016_04790 [Rhizobium tumorigenes]